MVLIRVREKNVKGNMSFISVIYIIGKQKQGSFSGAPALLCVGNRIMNYHPFCPTVLADLAKIKLNSDVLSSVWSQVTVQTCAAQAAPVLLLATARLPGWRRLRRVESGWGDRGAGTGAAAQRAGTGQTGFLRRAGSSTLGHWGEAAVWEP